jgi:hypothetical protein
LNKETAISKREGIAVGSHDSGENLLLFGVILRTAVHKTVFLSRVAMEITVDKQLSLLFHSFNHLLGVENGWV